MRIRIYSRPQERLRNNQAGDWEVENGEIFVSVLSSLPKESQLAVAIHELIEAHLCRENRITDSMVCAFDEKYEAEREKGQHKEDDEPGDDPRSPYRKEHMASTHVERAVCHAIGLSWQQHEQSLLESVEDHPKTASPASPHQLSPQPHQQHS